jgi:hypothetical protein
MWVDLALDYPSGSRGICCFAWYELNAIIAARTFLLADILTYAWRTLRVPRGWTVLETSREPAARERRDVTVPNGMSMIPAIFCR